MTVLADNDPQIGGAMFCQLDGKDTADVISLPSDIGDRHWDIALEDREFEASLERRRQVGRFGRQNPPYPDNGFR